MLIDIRLYDLIIPTLGIIIPNMKENYSITNILFPKVRQQVLGLLYGQPETDFYTNEIIRAAQSGTGAVQRELEKLANSGLITVKKVGNQRRYRANSAIPFFAELRSIIIKTFGLADVLRKALEPLFDKQIGFAFIYGSIAKQTDTANSDIDLLLIGDDLTYAEVFQLLEVAEIELGRKINPTFYSPREWIRKLDEDNNFIHQVLKQPKIFLLGTEDELAKLR